MNIEKRFQKRGGHVRSAIVHSLHVKIVSDRTVYVLPPHQPPLPLSFHYFTTLLKTTSSLSFFPLLHKLIQFTPTTIKPRSGNESTFTEPDKLKDSSSSPKKQADSKSAAAASCFSKAAKKNNIVSVD